MYENITICPYRALLSMSRLRLQGSDWTLVSQDIYNDTNSKSFKYYLILFWNRTNAIFRFYITQTAHAKFAMYEFIIIA